MSNFSVDFSVTENGRRAPEYTIDTDLDGSISLEDLLQFCKTALITVSNDVLREEQSNGFDKEPLTFVDGQKNKPVINVNPLGKIEFQSRQNIKDIVLDTYDGIQERSPVDTGKYIQSHVVLFNTTVVATDRSSLNAWLNSNPEVQDKDFITFVNTQPYARKLERYGVTAQRQTIRTQKSRDKRGRSGFNGRVLAPNGTYFLTARAIRRKYKRNSTIAFKLIPGTALGIAAKFKTQASGSRGGGRRKAGRGARAYLYPAIIISVQEVGIL